MTLTEYMRHELMNYGADLVGFGDLKKLPAYIRFDMPVGISVAVRYPEEIIEGIKDGPTKEYYEQYNILNKKLDMIATVGANTLKMLHYNAIPQTVEFVRQWEVDNNTMLPHKTVATRAGVGWIGKCAMLVTQDYGSMVRISSILTNAPLKTAKPVDKSNCGRCKICVDACPAGAVLGKNWTVDTKREDIYDATLCKNYAREISLKNFGEEVTQCGKCIYACPYTKNYLKIK